MTIGAWVMLVFGCVVLYGGLAVCLWIALRRRTPRDGEL
ncbi:MAG: MetS family NSS transporter small subunit [Planctomycetes bacterium]|nr:MetS family NSS transporter small subunit [Planctomycetota bacterium]